MLIGGMTNYARVARHGMQEGAGAMIPHFGGPMPVNGDTLINVTFRDGTTDDGIRADSLVWRQCEENDGDIMHYEVVKASRFPKVPAPAPKAEGDVYVIWSNEHRAWWGAEERGYVLSLQRAGRYTREHALKISKRARGGHEYNENPSEVPLLLADAEGFWPDKTALRPQPPRDGGEDA